MVYALIFVIIILILDIIINKLPKQKNENIDNKSLSSLYERKNYLLTQNELKFYKLLKNITDKYNLNLFSQVALYEIIKSKNIKDFNKIKSKTIDFVITDENSKIKICIELDDTTHLKETRKQRDNFINKLFYDLNIKLLRIPVQNSYENLEQEIIKNIK